MSRGESRPRDLRRIAIGVALVALLGTGIYRAFVSQSGGAPARYAAMLADAGMPPIDWIASPWDSTATPADLLQSDLSRSARLGALLFDLEIIVATDDVGFASVADDVALLLDGVPGGAAASTLYRTMAVTYVQLTSAELDRTLLAGRRSVARVVDEDMFELGAWLQAATLAALQRNDAFFSASTSRTMLNRLQRLRVALGALAPRAINIEATLAAPVRDWESLHADLSAVLVGLAG